MTLLYKKVCDYYALPVNDQCNASLNSFARIFFNACTDPSIIFSCLMNTLGARIQKLNAEIKNYVAFVAQTQIPKNSEARQEYLDYSGVWCIPEVYELERIAAQLLILYNNIKQADMPEYSATDFQICYPSRTYFASIARTNPRHVRRKACQFITDIVQELSIRTWQILTIVIQKEELATKFTVLLDPLFLAKYGPHVIAESELLEIDDFACNLFTRLMNSRPEILVGSYSARIYPYMINRTGQLLFFKSTQDSAQMRDLLWTNGTNVAPGMLQVIMLVATIYHICDLWMNDVSNESLANVCACLKRAGALTYAPDREIINCINVTKHLIQEKLNWVLVPLASEEEHTPGDKPASFPKYSLR